MAKDKKKLLFTIILAVIGIAIIGITYAYYMTRIVNNPTTKTFQMRTEHMEITYHDGTAEFLSGYDNGYVKPGARFEKTFSVENTGKEKANYTIVFENIINEFVLPGWKYELLSTDSNRVIQSEKKDILKNVSKQTISDGFNIESGETHNYKLVITYEEMLLDQSEDMEKKLALKVNIVEANAWDNEKEEGTLLYAIKNNNEVIGPKTNPGKQLSTLNEAVLSYDEDNDGTSYYFRGNVQNNYVTYSGMCWRVVRILGNGNIKLTLADENNTCDKIGTSNTSAYAFGRKNIAFKRSLKYSFDDVTFLDSEAHGVLIDWVIEKGLATKDTEDNLVYKNELVNEQWCNDYSVVNYSTNEFKSYYRLSPINEAKPTFKCEQSYEVNSYIGLLTSDEIAYAGATLLQDNETPSYYLMENATGSLSWTMSAYAGVTNYSYSLFITNRDGYLTNYWGANPYVGVRPTIVLNKNVVSTNADVNTYGLAGTKTNPYVIG